MKKQKILIFTDWFLPAFKAGGSVRSVSNLTDRLKDEFNFFIVASDRDFGDPNSFTGIVLNEWTEVNGIRVQYLDTQRQNIGYYKKLIISMKPDVVYLNSMFSLKFSIFPLLALRTVKYNPKVVLAPRGMLGKGALEIKPLKKKLFLGLGKLLGLYSAVCWHATSLEEAAEIKLQFGQGSKVKVAKNIPAIHAVVNRSKVSGALKLLFYSRVSIKKNLLESLKVLRDFNFSGKIDFTICGPIESESYWQSCQQAMKEINELKNGLSVNYIGSVLPTEAGRLFSENHVFFLPTRHENFGHVIAEALSSSMPVIISDQTPWSNLAVIKAGYDLSLGDMSEFALKIDEFIRMDQDVYNSWSMGAKSKFDQMIQVEDIAADTRNVFLGS